METIAAPGTALLRWGAAAAGIAYIVLFAATFATGVGAYLYGPVAPDAVATWAGQHADAVHAFVLLSVVGDWCVALFFVLMIAATGVRSASAFIACAGIVAAETVYAVVRGAQYALPHLAALQDGIHLAQVAVVLQGSLVLAVYPIPFGIGLLAAGYVLLRGRGVLRVLGAVAMVLAPIYASALIIRALVPAADFLELTVEALQLWMLATCIALLLPARWRGMHAATKVAQRTVADPV